MEPVTPVGVVDESGLRLGEFKCQVCGKPTRQKRKWARFCSASCRFAQWAKEHPRKPAGTVLVPAGSSVVLPNSVDSFQALADLIPKVIERGGPNVPPVGVPAALVPSVELDALRARMDELEKLPRYGRSSGQDPTKWKHGANCYRNHGCRCQVCREGNAVRCRKARAEGY